VAVNPRDPRYMHLIGKTVRRPLPIENQAALPIIGDEAVDFEFGTGVLKVTPAHDKADHEIGLRHELPVLDIMNPDGTMNELAGEDFAGLDRFEARIEAVEKLRELAVLVKEEPYENNVGFSERADVPIEPRLSEQWFLKYPKTAEARAAVRDGLIRFFPERWKVFRTGAYRASSGGAIGFPYGTNKPKKPDSATKASGKDLPTFSARLTLPARAGFKMPTCWTRGFHRGSGRMKRWMNPPGRSSIPPARW
jgi:hypothetical protein